MLCRCPFPALVLTSLPHLLPSPVPLFALRLIALHLDALLANWSVIGFVAAN